MHDFTVAAVARRRTKSTISRLIAWVVIPVAMMAGAFCTVSAQDPVSRPVPTAFQLQKNDRVLLIGGTFVERAQRYGHLETEILLRNRGKDLVLRNLGWSADTVFCDSRGIFDPPAAGYQRLLEQVQSLQPSVLVLNYGQNEFLEPGISKQEFIEQYQKLINDLNAAAPDSRVVIWSPHALFYAAPPLPDNRRRNGALSEWVEATRLLASRNDYPFVDLFSDLETELLDAQMKTFRVPEAVVEENQAAIPSKAAGINPPGTRDRSATLPDLKDNASAYWTDNGMHFHNHGYELMARSVCRRWLGSEHQERAVLVYDPSNERFQLSSCATTIDGRQSHVGRKLTMSLSCSNSLPVVLRVAGVSQRFVEPLTVLVSASESADLSKPVEIASAAIDVRQHSLSLFTLRRPWIEELRHSVIEKNRLYFHRWRPQNVTYLFGFRKHEQGQNAKEVAEFEGLVANAETLIREHLRSDETMTVEIRSDN